MEITGYSRQILMKLLMKKIFEKRLKYHISLKILSVGGELFYAGGRTDRHDEADSRFSIFFEGT
jgi:hypothetical protein